MKRIGFIFMIFSCLVCSQNLPEIRVAYKKAIETKKSLQEFQKLLDENATNSSVIMAYKGASCFLEAKFYSKNRKKKMKKGIELIEKAVKQSPNHIEIRFIRLGIQQHVPFFVRYRKNIKEDKTFVKKHISSVKDEQLKEIIQEYLENH